MPEIAEEFSPIVAEWVAVYEQEHGGKRPSKQVLQIVAYFERLGRALRELGHDDAKNMRRRLPFYVFYDLTKYVIAGPKAAADDCVQIYAELMHRYYSDGYDRELQ